MKKTNVSKLVNKMDSDTANTYMLNAKFLLIVWVVIANCIDPLIHQSAILKAVYLSIYTFHIPMFVMVTGYFSKNFQFNRAGIRSLQLIFYHYLLFQSLYSLLDALSFHAPGVHYSFFIPYSLLWFLFSHFCWRLLLLLFTKLQHPLVVSIALGVLIGYLPFTGAMFSFSRTIVFFPFFLAGYYFHPNVLPIQWLRSFRGLSVLLASGILLCLSVIPLDPKWLYSSYTYVELGQLSWLAGAYRLGIYALEATASFCFLCFVPHITSTLTEWGKHTVYVFLLHGLILKTIIATGLFRHIQSPAQIMLVILFAIALTWLLSQKWVRRLSRPLIEPNLSFLESLVTRKHQI
ncbi:acyltransferase family protein [Paenibacillus sp. SI8]|uniref:acyltransferase family protein n=1 Tax=unclassified Paenibacillus TaxID=185978 RepID=UPI0034650C8B